MPFFLSIFVGDDPLLDVQFAEASDQLILGHLVTVQHSNVAPCEFYLEVTGVFLAGEPRGVVCHRLFCVLAHPKEVVPIDNELLDLDGVLLQSGQQLFLGAYVTKTRILAYPSLAQSWSIRPLSFKLPFLLYLSHFFTK